MSGGREEEEEKNSLQFPVSLTLEQTCLHSVSENGEYAPLLTAAQLALAGDGEHSVTLDEAIEAVRITARDMHVHYKETSLAGLAVRHSFLLFSIRLSFPLEREHRDTWKNRRERTEGQRRYLDENPGTDSDSSVRLPSPRILQCRQLSRFQSRRRLVDLVNFKE